MSEFSRLTCQEESFCQFYAIDGKPSAAYRFAYGTDNMEPASIASNAQHVLKRPHIGLRIYELQQVVRDKPFKVALGKKIMYLQKVIDVGSQTLKNSFKRGAVEMVDSKSVISAIAELNRMDGDLAAQKKHISGPDGGPIETNATFNFIPVGNKD